MSRIPLVEPEAAPALVQQTYKELESWGMSLLNVMKLFANHAEFFAGFVQLAGALYKNLHLSPRYRELAYLRASLLHMLR